MILLIECKVDSDTLIDKVIECRINKYVFKLYGNDKNKLEKISIETKSMDYQKYVPTVDIENNAINSITFPKNDFYIEQTEMLQYIESFGALDLGIRKIHWDSPSINWIAENDDELIAINSYSRKKLQSTNNRKVTIDWVRDLLAHRNRVKHLTEPLSFYRIGVNHFHQSSFIEAFLHFYLMLEGVFGNGNTDKKHSIDSFMNAPYLKYGIDNVLNSFDNPIHKKHKDWFVNYFFKNQGINDDPVRKLVNIFFDERGKLSHYINKGERRRNNFEEDKYQSLAAISMMVCYFSSIKLRLDPFVKKE